MSLDSSPRTLAATANEGRTLHAYQVFLALHCLGFLGLLVARDADKGLKGVVEGLAVGASGAPPLSSAPWQVLTCSFLHQHPLELVITVTFLLLLGGPVERALGTMRFAVGYLGTGALVALGHVGIQTLILEPLGSHAGASLFLGGIGTSAALLSAYALLNPTSRWLNTLPAPALFCGAAVFLIMLTNYLEQEHARRTLELLASSLSPDQWLDRQYQLSVHESSSVPHGLGFLAGAGWIALDAVSSRLIARARLRREIRVLEEELEARARVEQLLEKISRDGLGALSRRERSFLKYASRFYPTGDRVATEGP